MATATKKQVQVWSEFTEPTAHDAVFDGRDWWIREESETHYVGTFGRETPVYGLSGVCWYKVRWEPLANAYVHVEGKDGQYFKVFDGVTFKRLETIYHA